MRKKIALDQKWLFTLDKKNQGLKNKYYEQLPTDAEQVLIPHTYNVGNGTDQYRGAAWYQYVFQVPEAWENACVRICFEGIYRDADFWVNGKTAGKHYGAGFTTFEINITDVINVGEENILTVRVDNQYSPYALPWFDQFDWADDGGIFRPVYFEITAKCAIQYALIDAEPDFSGPIDSEKDSIEENENSNFKQKICNRVDSGKAKITCNIVMLEETTTDFEIMYELLEQDAIISTGELKPQDTIIIEHVKYWHFDAPNMYTFRLKTVVSGKVTDVYETQIGFRKFEIRGKKLILNGEQVHLVGTEWMPGSDPRIGNAERPEDLEKYLKLLKGCNCIFTRVHWQQSDYFYRWCDTHGLMVQEEIPLWGQPKEPVASTLEMVKAQGRETILSHYNHPSIICWGIGNELNGQSEITKHYVRDAVAFFRTIDAKRPVSYVSNTMWESPDDACTVGDIQMCNDYIGTWHQGYDNVEAVQLFRNTNPDKPIVISEFGLCEPAFPGGDPRREEIFLEKIEIYRKNDIQGFIYFCLNDYRTQMGEEGTGRLRQRVHGSTDLYGNPKPSYYAVKRECAPLKIHDIKTTSRQLQIEFMVKKDLPSYAVRGYYAVITAAGQTPVLKRIPDGNPGDMLCIKADINLESNIGSSKEDIIIEDTIKDENNHLMEEINISVFRPNGEEVFCYKTNLRDSKYC